ncbi:hypothetical protein CDL15_Pgr022706 [Punica granatum]|uniref:cAMP-regulated phosphoprotein 19-related protein n=1 Tax=Punica granatum TaxID=22663 RepID=A0A218XRM5_PUNGR|nr:hypothetical protein CDL15_Pgr022706 [Punica granatum]
MDLVAETALKSSSILFLQLRQCVVKGCCCIIMSEMEEVKDHERVEGNAPGESEKPLPSVQDEEAAVKKKYGGIVPKKPPLISKDHERAYFDSADWALGKPTQQQTRYRKSPYAPSGEEEGGSAPPEDTNATV